MSPILGIFASQGRVSATSYESIATVTVGAGGSSSLDFTSIPSTYKHLQIRGIGRTNRSGSIYDGALIRVNSDSTNANYTYHYLYGDGSTVGSTNENGAWPGAQVNRLSGSTAGSNIFGALIVDLLDYANVSKNKTIRTLGAVDNNGSGEIYLNSNLWINTSAITTISILPRTGTLFTQYTQFALYGIK